MRKTKIAVYGIICAMVLMVFTTPLGSMASDSDATAIVDTKAPQNQGILDPVATSDGKWNPTNQDNRFRRSEFPEGDFFQWWYYAVKSSQTGEYWAFCYFMNYCPTDPSLEGLMFLFSYIKPSVGKVQVAYKAPISDYVYEGNYLQLSFNSGNFKQIPTTNDQYTLKGLMNNATNIWTFYSTIPEYTEDSIYQWDVTLNRIVGCQTQNDFATLQDLQSSLGLLNADSDSSVLWNSQMFNALPTGTIKMGDRVVQLSGAGLRGYGDMNWGQSFISKSDEPTNPHKYFWGWLSTSCLNNANPSAETSMIVAYANDKKVLGMESGMSAVFASVANVMNQNVAWKSVKTQPFGLGVNLIEKCSWGSGADCQINCQFSADQWFIYSDKYGQAEVPAHQQLTLENEWCKIVINAYVNASCISRLLTPNKAGIWSNFEALGAVANVNIYQKTYKWYDPLHTSPSYSIWKSYTDTSCGLEFGYEIDGVIP